MKLYFPKKAPDSKPLKGKTMRFYFTRNKGDVYTSCNVDNIRDVMHLRLEYGCINETEMKLMLEAAEKTRATARMRQLEAVEIRENAKIEADNKAKADTVAAAKAKAKAAEDARIARADIDVRRSRQDAERADMALESVEESYARDLAQAKNMKAVAERNLKAALAILNKDKGKGKGKSK